MKTVLVTGSQGFIGKNLCAQLNIEFPDLEILSFDRGDSDESLTQHLEQAEFIFHLAGVNRPENDSEFKEGNLDLTTKILKTLEETKKNTPVLITSSKQAEQDNPYGKSKKAAEDAVKEWSKNTSTQSYIYRLPGVFGKWCRPNYNSVVATFCSNIATGLDITINDPSSSLTLVYVDDVIGSFILAMQGEQEISEDGFCEVAPTFTITLQELADKLYGFRDIRKTLQVPNFEQPLDRYLYATFTSYFDTDDFGYKLDMKRDDRGWLAEIIKSHQFGQTFISRSKPGISRGNHWHHTKIEKFLVVDGKADIKLRNLHSEEILNYTVSGDDLRVIDIPAGYVHSITNTGDKDLLTIFWSDEIFDPENPDTHYLEV